MKSRTDELAAEKIDRARIMKKLKFCVHRVEICSFKKNGICEFHFHRHTINVIKSGPRYHEDEVFNSNFCVLYLYFIISFAINFSF